MHANESSNNFINSSATFIHNTTILPVITGNFSICLPGPTTTQLTGSGIPASTNPWISSNPAVATVNSAGLVTSVSFGTTTIIYTNNLGETAAANVSVSTFPTINAPFGTSTCQGANLQLEGSLFPNAINPWESLNPATATVDNLGLVTGVSAGMATIRYRNLGGCTSTIAITIRPLLLPAISCGTVTSSSITFNWTAVPGALTYVRSYQLNGGPFMSAGSGSSSAYTLSGLTAGSTVDFYVAPSGPVGSCFQVGIVQCQTLPCAAASTPNSPIIDLITWPTCSLATGSVDISGLPTGNWTLNQFGTVVEAINGVGESITISQLVPGNYTFTVTNNLGCTSGPSVNVNIPLQPITPTPPVFVIVEPTCIIPTGSIIINDGQGNTYSFDGGPFTAVLIYDGLAAGSVHSISAKNAVGCISLGTFVTIPLISQPNAGIDGCISVTDTNPIAIDLFSLIGGEQSGGTWTRDAGTGGTFSGVSGTFIPTVGATTSTFEYSLPGIIPCLDAVSTATIFVNESSNGAAVSLFCEPLTVPENSRLIDWNNVGQTSFNYFYSINGGPTVSGNTIISNFQVFNVPNDASVSFTVQPIGNICYPSTTTNCGSLSASVFESETFTYYPNPFHDILNMKFAQSANNIQIFNLLGQQVFANDLNEKEIQINLSHLSSGTYLVKANALDSFKTFKIIKN